MLAQNQAQSDNRKLWLPLRVKITLPYLILALLLAAGAAHVTNRVVFDSMEERFTNQLIESGKLVSEAMVTQESARLESLRLLGNIVGVSDAIQSGRAENLRALTFGVTASQGDDLVDFLDSHGNLVLAMRRKPDGSTLEYTFTTGGGIEYLTYEAIRKVLAQDGIGHGEKTAGLVQLPWGNYFVVIGPVYTSSRELAGVIIIGRSLARLADELRQSSLTHVSLYDANGTQLASTLTEPQTVSLEMARSVLDAQNRFSMRRTITASSLPYQEILGPWEARAYEDLGIIGSALPETFFVRASAITRANIITLVFLTLFLVIVVGIYLANYITEPLFGLLRASQQVANGDLQVQVAVSSADEIASLTESFNRMVASLHRSKRDLVEAYDRTIEGWVKALELRDEETEGHSGRVVDMTLALAQKIGIPERDLAHMRRGVLLHDIGKMVIPDDVLFKEGPLTYDERELVLKHPQYAYHMLADIEFLHPALDIPLYHHERWDGSGYPGGLKEHTIPLPARIFAVADVFDAMTNDRRYRKRLTREVAIDHIRQNSGILFDPQVVQAFLELVAGSNGAPSS